MLYFEIPICQFGLFSETSRISTYGFILSLVAWLSVPVWHSVSVEHFDSYEIVCTQQRSCINGSDASYKVKNYKKKH